MDDDVSDEIPEGVEVVDLRGRADGRVAGAAPASPDGVRRSRRSGSARRWAALAALVVAAGIGWTLLSDDGDVPAPATTPAAATPAAEAPAVATPSTGSPLPVAPGDGGDATTLPPSGPTQLTADAAARLAVAGSADALVVVDRAGVRFAHADDGAVSRSTPVGLILSPVVADADGVVAVDDTRGRIVEIAPDGTRRAIAAVGPSAAAGSSSSVVALTAELVWVADPSRGLTLVALARDDGSVVERLRFPTTVELVGFHGGRPLTAVPAAGSESIVRHEADGARIEIATGWVIAQSGGWLLYRPCRPDGACQEPTLLDLDTDDRTPAIVPPDVGAYGSWGRSLSPDGRWLVGLQLGDRTGPSLALHQVVADTDGTVAEPLVLTAGALGFGGRSLALAWSPGGELLAAPGSAGVTVVDPAARSIDELPIRLDGDLPSVAWIPREGVR